MTAWLRRLLLLLLFASPLLSQASLADPRIALLHPKGTGPYAAIFDSIAAGVAQVFVTEVQRIAVPSDADIEAVAAELRPERFDGVIALGPEGYRVVSEADGDTRPATVGGAYFLPAGGLPGISLAAAPETLFSTLRALSPGVQRVHVVYDPEQNQWLMELAERAARRNGVELHAHPEKDLRGAVKRYRALIEETLGPSDALWLPVDATTVYDKVVLPLILQAAWDLYFTVFSSKPSHAKHGALFSLLPDHEAMGRRLAEMLRARLEDSKRELRLEPLRDLQVAVNVRTAAHLGIHFSSAELATFALTFPSR